jgi:hypothetical protein
MSDRPANEVCVVANSAFLEHDWGKAALSRHLFLADPAHWLKTVIARHDGVAKLERFNINLAKLGHDFDIAT